MAVHGALADKDAALFVECDGFWRDVEKEELENDQKKNWHMLMQCILHCGSPWVHGDKAKSRNSS